MTVLVGITNTSQISGVERTKVFRVDPALLRAWDIGRVAAETAFPDLTKEEIDFIMTGNVPEDYKE